MPAMTTVSQPISASANAGRVGPGPGIPRTYRGSVNRRAARAGAGGGSRRRAQSGYGSAGAQTTNEDPQILHLLGLHGIASAEELIDLASQWEAWGRDPQAFFAFPWCRVLATR